MAINRVKAPQSVDQAAAKAISDFVGDSVLERSSIGGAIAEAEPLEIFSVELSNLSADSIDVPLRRYGWRYIVDGGGDERLFADITSGQDSQGGRPALSMFSKGAIVKRMIEAAAILQNELNASTDYEISIIDAPNLRVSALQCVGPESRRFIPFAGAPVSIISEQAFLQLLNERAAIALTPPPTDE